MALRNAKITSCRGALWARRQSEPWFAPPSVDRARGSRAVPSGGPRAFGPALACARPRDPGLPSGVRRRQGAGARARECRKQKTLRSGGSGGVRSGRSWLLRLGEISPMSRARARERPAAALRSNVPFVQGQHYPSSRFRRGRRVREGRSFMRAQLTSQSRNRVIAATATKKRFDRPLTRRGAPCRRDGSSRRGRHSRGSLRSRGCCGR